MLGDDDESDDRSVDALRFLFLFHFSLSVCLYKLSTIGFQFIIERLKSMHAHNAHTIVAIFPYLHFWL